MVLLMMMMYQVIDVLSRLAGLWVSPNKDVLYSQVSNQSHWRGKIIVNSKVSCQFYNFSYYQFYNCDFQPLYISIYIHTLDTMLFQTILSIIHPEIRFDFLSGVTPPNNLQLGFLNEQSLYIIHLLMNRVYILYISSSKVFLSPDLP